MDSIETELRGSIVDLIGPKLGKLKSLAMGMIVLGAILSVVGFVMNQRGFFESWLFAWLFWGGATIGCVALLALHHTVGGGWGWVLRRFLEAGTGLLVPMLLLLIPVLLTVVVPDWKALYAAEWVVGEHTHYGWANPQSAKDTVIEFKRGWLNMPRFIGFTFLYFVLWLVLAGKLKGFGKTFEQRNDPRVFEAANKWGGAGLVIMVLTITFATVDWVMTLTPHWLSSIIGLLYCAANVLSALSLLLWLAGYLGGDVPLVRHLGPKYFRDLGNLMLATVMLWAYMSFSQYVIIYSANVAEYAPWYVARAQGGWGVLSLGLIIVHFALPFFILLVGSGIKKDPKKLGYVALFIMCMRFLDLLWWVAPNFRSSILALNPADLGAPLLIGGIWLTVWAGQLSKMTDVPLIPAHDPRVIEHVHEVVAHHG